MHSSIILLIGICLSGGAPPPTGGQAPAGTDLDTPPPSEQLVDTTTSSTGNWNVFQPERYLLGKVPFSGGLRVSSGSNTYFLVSPVAGVVEFVPAGQGRFEVIRSLSRERSWAAVDIVPYKDKMAVLVPGEHHLAVFDPSKKQYGSPEQFLRFPSPLLAARHTEHGLWAACEKELVLFAPQHEKMILPLPETSIPARNVTIVSRESYGVSQESSGVSKESSGVSRESSGVSQESSVWMVIESGEGGASRLLARVTPDGLEELHGMEDVYPGNRCIACTATLDRVWMSFGLTGDAPGGLVAWDSGTASLLEVRLPNDLSGSGGGPVMVTALASVDGSLWLGTDSAGAVRVEVRPAGESQLELTILERSPDELNGRIVYDFIPDGGNLYILTTGAIARYQKP